VLLKYATLELINLCDREHVSALHWSVLCQGAEHCLRLIKGGAQLGVADAEGRTPLHYAVTNDSSRCLKVLLENASGEEINQKDSKGRTALHMAVSAEV
jgi:ankyrin repeat protein